MRALQSVFHLYRATNAAKFGMQAVPSVSQSKIVLNMDVDDVEEVTLVTGRNTSLEQQHLSLDELRHKLSSQPNDHGHVELHKNELTGIATVLLHNPRKKNALSGNMMVQLDEIITDLENWKAGRGLLLHGKEAPFCSGADLNLVKSIQDKPTGLSICSYVQKTFSRLFHLPLVTAALVQGTALGGGAELATSCDLRLMSQDASFGFVQVKMGISTAFGGGTRLVQLLGRNKALDILTSCDVHDAIQARDLGWANGIVSSGEQGVEEAHSWLEKRTSGNPSVIQAIKGVVVCASNSQEDSNASLTNELLCLAKVWGGDAQTRALKSKTKYK